MKPLAIAVSSLVACAAPPTAGPCAYDAYQGTCRLTDVWLDRRSKETTVEARYDTPRGPEIYRQTVPNGRAERLRAHLAAHPQIGCRGDVIRRGTCEPSHLELDLPPLSSPP